MANIISAELTKRGEGRRGKTNKRMIDGFQLHGFLIRWLQKIMIATGYILDNPYTLSIWIHCWMQLGETDSNN